MNALVENSPLLAAKAERLIAVEAKMVLPDLSHEKYRVDVDFSLAIHNRTGKYFIGQELLGMADLPVGDVRYWRFARNRPPSGLAGRIIGRLQHMQVLGRTIGGSLAALPQRKSKRPLLHLDPFTVPTTLLHPRDAVLIHDVGPLTHPELFDPVVGRVYRHIYEKIAEVGPHLIFVSQHSRCEFDRLFPAARASSRRIVHPPIRPALYNIRSRKPDADIPERFLLTVGSIGRRKNQLHSIEGYARSGLVHQGVGYVICGGAEPNYAEVEAMARRTPGVVLMPYVPDEVLSWLYQHAAGFVLMSVLEGFGMPVSEAVRCGLVPLVSRDSALTEITGDAAYWADPMDADEIAAQMQALVHLTDGERIDRMRRLTQSIERFDLMRFRQGWRAAFADILAYA